MMKKILRFAPSSSALKRLSFLLLTVLVLLAHFGNPICYGVSMWVSDAPTKLDQRYYIDVNTLNTLDIYYNFDFYPQTGADCVVLSKRYSVAVDGFAMPTTWMTFYENGGSPFIRV